MYFVLATIAYFTMVMGLKVRKNTPLHFKLMLFAIVLDFFIVGLLEFKRDAINTALSFKLPILQQLHIGVSSVAAALYIPILVLGFCRLKGLGSPRTRAAHIYLGITAFVFRSLGFLLMFSMLQKSR